MRYLLNVSSLFIPPKSAQFVHSRETQNPDSFTDMEIRQGVATRRCPCSTDRCGKEIEKDDQAQIIRLSPSGPIPRMVWTRHGPLYVAVLSEHQAILI